MLHEACGVFGYYDNAGDNVAEITYLGLFALQHRGQESAGIAVSDKNNIHIHKDSGLVQEVFRNGQLEQLTGRAAIGHTRYSTAGGTGAANAQPLSGFWNSGQLAVAHNGNLSNASLLRRELLAQGAILQTTADSELILHLLARTRTWSNSLEEAAINLMGRLEGAFSVVVLGEGRLIAFRDPHGMRPLCLGQRGNSYAVASESCALDAIGAHLLRDVRPGEVLRIDENGLHSFTRHCGQQNHICIFEYLYFARPDSIIEGVGVHEARKITGRILAETFPVEADLVIGVPDSGTDAAVGYSEASGIPFGRGLIVNPYVGRTFIQPTQDLRSAAVKKKLHAVADAVRNRRVVMVDDSLVRGTTCAKLVSMIKEAGAREVHMRISAPPFLWPCYFGTDVPSREHLIAVQYSVEEIRQRIGADSLGFMPVERLRALLPDSCGYCDGCFSGNYPYTPVLEDEVYA